jgi:hypothetical protein
MRRGFFGRIQDDYIPKAGWNKQQGENTSTILLVGPQGVTVRIATGPGHKYQNFIGDLNDVQIIKNDLRAKGFKYREHLGGGCAFEPGTY